LKKIIFLSLLIFIVISPLRAMAEKADHDKPMNIEADSLLYDDLKQTSVFTGHAVLTKGSLVMRGQRIEVYEDPDGYQFGTAFSTEDTRAFFRQKREGVDEHLEGEAKRIEYDGRSDRVTLHEEGEIRRYRVTTLADQMFGKRIIYNNLTDIFTIDGQPAADGKPSATPAGRVRATLTPRKTASAEQSSEKDKK
jgi:lipopolysaccharide export system protein LptA